MTRETTRPAVGGGAVPPPAMTRRDFLATTGAAGALAAGTAPPQALNRIARLTIAPRAGCFIGSNGTASPYFANCLVKPLATSASIGAFSM